MSFNERATYETYYSQNPDDTDITPMKLEQWSAAIEPFAQPISAELTSLGVPDTELNRSNVLVLAFLYRQGTVGDRVQRAAWFYDQTGLKDMG